MDDEAREARAWLNPNPRFSSLAGMCVLAVVIVALAYLAGVMRGRASLERQPEPQETAAPPSPPQELDKILTPEELRFSSALKDSPSAAQRSKALDPVKPLPEHPAPSPGGQAQIKPVQSLPQDGMYDYVFQVAALRDEDNADALRQRLEGRGLRTRMRRDGKNLLVFVLLRGTEQRAAEVTRLMEDMRLGKPVLRGKKSATP
ncbi:MAG: SPOR domain-containing protein [Desulfovibrio sp.]|jgi:cell division septation protein DedD|nr:SPOR domain-containing protein [Desulfovibrio sp.]